MASEMLEYPQGAVPVLEDNIGHIWTPLFWQACSFTPEIFKNVMMNLIRNPNINSNHLFRADILLETPYNPDFACSPDVAPRLVQIESFDLTTVIVRRLIPRNARVDRPLDQTCLLYTETDGSETKSLVLYLPHICDPSESPFYHPAVRGIAFLHSFDSQSLEGVTSIHYAFFESGLQSSALKRTGLHLLEVLHKHGQGTASGYVKRVQHDNILPQAAVQNTYARLKAKYAKLLITSWVEVTDPTKHVFEDLSIAAFLIELWEVIYPKGVAFPGFVDIGCGNGLLVNILLTEGYIGWGFDARKRKSWNTFQSNIQENLKELVLVPFIFKDKVEDGIWTSDPTTNQNETQTEASAAANPRLYDGSFPKGTFIVSNHADELTPWTPILATLSESPFLIIPCCSHNLTGSRFRAPAPNLDGTSNSAYSSLVSWVGKLAEACGWAIEKEMLRIPSTRNAALIGRQRTKDYASVDVKQIVDEYGGAVGWVENAMKLVKSGPRGH